MFETPGKIHWMQDDVAPDRPLKTGFSMENGDLTVHHWQDMTSLFQMNESQYAQNERPTGKEWHQFARIPGMAHEWKMVHGVDVMNPDHWDAVMRLLHDPRYRKCRTAPGEFRKKVEREYHRGSSSSVGTPMELIGEPRPS